MKNINKLFTVIVTLLFFSSCIKEQGNYVTPVQPFFSSSNGSYAINNPDDVFRIPIGLTGIPKSNVTLKLSISGSATVGTHYTLKASSFQFNAEKLNDTIVVQGIQSMYLSGRVDTLYFTFDNSSDIKSTPSSFGNSFRLIIKGPCKDSDISTDYNSLLGDYTNTSLDNGAPFKSTIKSIVSTSSTSADITVSNLQYDASNVWNDLTFTLDWSSTPTITLQSQNSGMDAGVLNSTYTGNAVAISPLPSSVTNNVGSFEFCNQVLTLRFRYCIPSLGGCFRAPHEVIMSR